MCRRFTKVRMIAMENPGTQGNPWFRKGHGS